MSGFSPFSLAPRKLFSSVSSPSPATTEESVTPPPSGGILRGVDGSEHTLKTASSTGTLPRYSSTESDLNFVGTSMSDRESPRTPLTPLSVANTTLESASSNQTLASRLSAEQLNALQRQEIITTQTPTDPKTLGAEYVEKRSMFSAALSPTTQAYVLSKRSPKDIIDAFYDVSNGQELIPEADKIVLNFDPDTTDPAVTYHIKQETGNPILPRLEDEITIKSVQEELPGGRHVVSFDQPEKSRNYFRKIKGSLTTEPYGDQTLVCLETFVDLRGKILPRLVQNDDLREITVEFLHRILDLR